MPLKALFLVFSVEIKDGFVFGQNVNNMTIFMITEVKF